MFSSLNLTADNDTLLAHGYTQRHDLLKAFSLHQFPFTTLVFMKIYELFLAFCFCFDQVKHIPPHQPAKIDKHFGLLR